MTASIIRSTSSSLLTSATIGNAPSIFADASSSSLCRAHATPARSRIQFHSWRRSPALPRFSGPLLLPRAQCLADQFGKARHIFLGGVEGRDQSHLRRLLV